MTSRLRINKTLWDISDIVVISAVWLIFCQLANTAVVKLLTGMGWYLIVGLATVRIILEDKGYQRGKIKKSLIWFVIWAFFYILIIQNYSRVSKTYILGLGINSHIIQAIQNLMIVIIGIGICKSDKYDYKIMASFIIIFIINIFYTLRALVINPNISKFMATGNVNSSVDVAGVVGYGFIYAIIFIIPILLVFMMEIKKVSIKILVLSGLVSILLFIYQTGYFTATILSILMICLVLIFSMDIRLKLILAIPTIVISTIVINPKWICDILYSIIDRINNFNIIERLEQIARFIETQQKGDTLARIDLYMYSINSFVNSPILGNALFTKEYRASGHAEILDMMAHGGILLLIPFLCFLYYSFRNTLRYAVTKKQRKGVTSIYIGYILLNCINTSFSSVGIMFTLIAMIPVLLRIGNRIGEKCNENTMAM